MNYSQVTVDILQNPRYAGAIDSVRWLTEWIDTGFGWAITIVAFLIILVAMFKNVLAAAYCAYPKFWSAVDTAHKECAETGWVTQFKQDFNLATLNGGSFSHAIMRLLPNIKALTDFEGDTLSPKAYFIRAIPQMLACVIIGAFIYNGYYRDVAAKVVDFGSEMVKRVLLEVDPIAVFDQFTGSSGRPVFVTDNSLDARDQLINKLSVNVYNAVIGEYNDISGSEAKRALATAIENKIQTWIGELENYDVTYTDGESWKPVTQVVLTNGAVDILNPEGSRTDTVHQYMMQFPVSELNISSTLNIGVPMHVRVRLNFEKQAVKAGDHAVKDLVLYLDSSGTCTVPAGSRLFPDCTAGAITVVQGSATGTVQISENMSTKSRTIKVGSIAGGSYSGTYTLASVIKVRDSGTGRYHEIREITFDSASGGTMSSALEGRAGITWTTEDLGITTSSKAA